MVLVPLIRLTKAADSDDAVLQEELQAQWQLLWYAACGGILVGVAIKTVFDTLTKRVRPTACDAEYDPASPHYLTTSEKYPI